MTSSIASQLAEHVKVVGARLEMGLLSIGLVREIPEAMRPRRISIGGDNLKVLDCEAA